MRRQLLRARIVSSRLSESRDPAAYARIRRRLWLAELALTIGLAAAFVALGWAQRVAAPFEAWAAPWPAQVAAYSGLLWLATVLLFFPLDWWQGFRLEHRFGLSNHTPGSWLKDHAKHLALGALFGLIAVESLSALLRLSPERWWLWTAAMWFAWSAALTRIFPTWLLPLFYRQKPVENAALTGRLERFLERCGAPVRGVFEVNLSRTTKKANACLCGMGATRRVLLSDTLLSRYPEPEIEVVLAHEVGHHRLHHVGTSLVAGAAATAAACFLVDQAARPILDGCQVLDLAPMAGLTELAALPVIGLGLALANLALLPVTNGLSRFLERQADRFALEKTGNPGAFMAAMRRLAEQNLAELSPPRWVEWLLYDHPPIAKRLAMAERWHA